MAQIYLSRTNFGEDAEPVAVVRPPPAANLLQHHDDLLGWELSLVLRLDVGFHQAFLDGFPLRLEAFQAVRVEEAKPGREPP